MQGVNSGGMTGFMPLVVSPKSAAKSYNLRFSRGGLITGFTFLEVAFFFCGNSDVRSSSLLSNNTSCRYDMKRILITDMASN